MSQSPSQFDVFIANVFIAVAYKVRHGILQIATGVTKCDGFITKLRQYILCAKGTRAVPDKQKASAKELVVHVDNSMNNWSSNISKISVFGKGKYCFRGP